MQAVLSINNLSDHSFSELFDCISFTLEKERYTPYSTLTAQYLLADSYELAELCEVKFAVNGKLLHYGAVDEYTDTKCSAMRVLTVKSRGYGLSLGLNQPTPGVYYGLNLTEFLAQNYALPNITCEPDTPTVNYLLVKESSSIWEAVVNLSLKSTDNYPYIYGMNEIRFTPHADRITVVPHNVISKGEGSDLSKLISHVHMADVDGSYNSFNYENEYAIARGILRHKQITFDRQWLHNPQGALTSRADFSMRGTRFKTLEYYGYSGEDLLDFAVLDGVTREIDFLRISGANGQVKTRLKSYTDAYCD